MTSTHIPISYIYITMLRHAQESEGPLYDRHYVERLEAEVAESRKLLSEQENLIQVRTRRCTLHSYIRDRYIRGGYIHDRCICMCGRYIRGGYMRDRRRFIRNRCRC